MKAMRSDMSEYAEYYDVDIEDYIKPEPTQKECLSYLSTGAWIFFGGSRGGGKSELIHNIVITPFGERKIGDLKVGDILNNPDGSLQKVIYLHPIEYRDVFRLHFEDGTYTDCSDNHLWNVKVTSKRKTKSIAKLAMIESSGNPFICNDEVWTTQMIMDWLDRKESADETTKIKNQHITIPLTEPVRFTKSYKVNMRPIHPYLLGVMLGDGSFTMTTNTALHYDKPDEEIAERLRSFGYDVQSRSMHRVVSVPDAPVYLQRLKLDGTLSHTKFIPESYKYDTIENRKLLVQGLMDTDGYVDDRGHLSYTTVSEQLALDFQWLVRSLGAKATITSDIGKYRDSSGDIVECRRAYTVYFNSKINSELVWLPRKRERTLGKSFNGGISELRRRIVGWEHRGQDYMRCITVSNPNGLYLTDDFVVTHNSWLARASAFLVAHRYPGIVICIIRETESELVNNFIDKCPLEYPPDIFGYSIKRKDRIIMFDNGSKIIFQPLRNEQDAKKIQGIEYQYIIIDEANNFPITMIDAIKGSLRSAMNNDFVPTLLMTGNPGGLNDMYFKSRYINPNYSMWTPEELKYQHLYVYVKSMTSDNPYIDEAYYQNLGSLDEKRRRAWLEGDWDVFVGQFFTSFSMEKHVVDDFEIPQDWRIVAGLDLGFSKDHPTMCYWLAQDPVTLRIYVCHEYEAYSSIQRYVYDIAYINKTKFRNVLIYADKTMWNKNMLRQESDESPAMYFVREGLPLVAANNDRVNGWRMFKQWLHYENDQVPLLQFFRSCNKAITTLPLLKHATRMGSHTEDCDSRGPDDAADAIRYALVTGFEYPSETERVERQSYYNNVKPQTLETEYKIYNIYGDLNKTFASAAATF